MDEDFGLRHIREKWFCKPQLLHVLPFAIYLSLWFADQVRPQFRHSWFVCRLGAEVYCRWFDWRKSRCGIIALTCDAGCVFEICNWFRCPSSIFMTKRRAWCGSRVSLSNSRWFSGSCKFAMKRSLIIVSYWFSRSQFSDNSFNLPKKCSIDSPFDCFVVRSVYLSKVMFRWRMNVHSMICQSSTVVNMSILRCGFLLYMMRLPAVTKLRYSILSYGPPVSMACLHT